MTAMQLGDEMNAMDLGGGGGTDSDGASGAAAWLSTTSKIPGPQHRYPAAPSTGPLCYPHSGLPVPQHMRCVAQNHPTADRMCAAHARDLLLYRTCRTIGRVWRHWRRR